MQLYEHCLVICVEGSVIAGLVGAACGACLAILHMHYSSCGYNRSYPLKCYHDWLMLLVKVIETLM